MAQWVKDPMLLLLGQKFNPLPRNFHMPQLQKERKKDRKKEGRKEGRKERKKGRQKEGRKKNRGREGREGKDHNIGSLASLSGLRIRCCCKLMGHRCSSDPALLWLWHRPAGAAWIQQLAGELPYATGVAPERKKESRLES